MQAAEGKGPKQVKKPYVLGNFQTIYANDGVPGGAAAFTGSAYTAVQGPVTISGQTWAGGQVGSAVPGLNINVNGNGKTDVGFVCTPSPYLSLQDIETLYVDFWVNPTFSGTAYVELQGSNNRFQNNTTYPASNWITILTGTLTGTGVGQTFTINNLISSAEYPKLCYRVIASGTTTTSGIIDWAIPGLFVDYNAMGIGINASDANGGIGQMSIQMPRYLSISGGQVTSTTNGNMPHAAIKNDVDYYG
jgi:hypothetical protein